MIKLYQLLFLRKICQLADEDQMPIVHENTIKHAMIALIAILMAPIAVFTKLAPFLTENPLILKAVGTMDPSSLSSIIMVTGTAWFMVSFGSIPKKLEEVAMGITFWMFLAFVLSVEWLVIFMAIDSPISAPFLFLVFWAVYAAAVRYDTMDALKSGLDESLLRHSRLGRAYYRKQFGKDANAIEAGKEYSEGGEGQ